MMINKVQGAGYLVIADLRLLFVWLMKNSQINYINYASMKTRLVSEQKGFLNIGNIGNALHG